MVNESDDDQTEDPLDGDVWDGLEREKGDDDGVEYADPRDEQEERRRALADRFDELMRFVLGPRPE